MIPGIVAAQAVTQVLIEGFVHADFINEDYAVDGAGVAASYLIDNPEFVTVNGLELGDGSGWATVPMNNEAESIMLSLAWTATVEFTLTNTGNTVLFKLEDNTGLGTNYFMYGMIDTRFIYFYEVKEGITTRDVVVPETLAVGVHTCVFTRTASTMSVAVDGGSVVTSSDPALTPDVMPTIAQFGLGDNNVYIRKFDLDPL